VAPNALFTLEERAHENDNGILVTPGNRFGLETLYVCTDCDGRTGMGSLQIFGQATSTVTSLGDGDHDGDDPVSTPEPSSLISLLAGLAAMTLAIYAMRESLTLLSVFRRLRA
jgi:hypothetical protein